jgi:hypothetical protein
VKSPIFYRKDEALLLCRDSPTSKVVRHNIYEGMQKFWFWTFRWYINHLKNLITQEEMSLQNLYRFFRPSVYSWLQKKTGTEI